jgi:hypothetical protein
VSFFFEGERRADKGNEGEREQKEVANDVSQIKRSTGFKKEP